MKGKKERRRRGRRGIALAGGRRGEGGKDRWLLREWNGMGWDGREEFVLATCVMPVWSGWSH